MNKVKLELTHSKHLVRYAGFLTKIGEPVGRFLHLAGLPGSCLDDPGTAVPTAALWRFREVAATRTGLPNLTLNVMGSSGFTDLGRVAEAVLCAPTLLAMMQSFQRLTYTESSTANFGIHPCHDEGVIYSNRFALRHRQGEWHAELYVLLWMLKLVRLVDPAWSPQEICCMSKATPDRVRAIESLTQRARFGEACTSFFIPASMLALPRRSGDSQLLTRTPDERSIWSTAPSDSYSGAIKQVIRAYAGDGWLTVNETSEVVGTSVRTMQRRLSAENKTYTEVLEETRAEIAGNLLENTDATMFEISQQLGYSDQSHFTRAFRRWAAVSPTEFRAQRRLA
jgi:AraC-like DNA-binding protein